jgi:hypothetical protein
VHGFGSVKVLLTLVPANTMTTHTTKFFWVPEVQAHSLLTFTLKLVLTIQLELFT